MNSVSMVGRLTRDPELRFIPGSGKAVATFAIAVDRPFSNKKTADFFNVVVWGKPAENAANYLTKGRQIALTGYLQSRSYEDKTGMKRYVTEIVANNVEFIGKFDRKDNQEDVGITAEECGENHSLSEFEESGFTADYSEDGFQHLEDDDDIPFVRQEDDDLPF